MSECQCSGPGYCIHRGAHVSSVGHRICSRGDERSKLAYFGDGRPRERRVSRAPSAEAIAARDAGVPCRHLGGPVDGPDGRQETRLCGPCKGKTRLKVFGCSHPRHAGNPTTTVGKTGECATCRDYEPREDDMGWSTRRDMGGIPVPMVAPGDKRPQIWHGGILQVWTTRLCNQGCVGCTQGSQFAGKPGMITVEQYERAVASLADYPGIVGMFGGLPTMHPQFPELCRVLKAHIPFERRGLWANDLRGHGALCRQTFNPKVSNLNTHLDMAARDEMVRDWPECAPYVKGFDSDSKHTTPWVGMSDLIEDEAERWRLIGDCDINRNWSAMICVVRGDLRGFFCEIAGAMAMLHQDNPDWAGTGAPMPDIGVPIEPGWWKRPMKDFEHQVRTCCMNCGVPMRRAPQLAIGGDHEEVSKVHEPIGRPKRRERPVELVTIGGLAERPERPATNYLPGTTPGYKGQ